MGLGHRSRRQEKGREKQYVFHNFSGLIVIFLNCEGEFMAQEPSHDSVCHEKDEAYGESERTHAVGMEDVAEPVDDEGGEHDRQIV